MFRQVKRGARPDRPSQIAREVRLMKELKAKHEETLLTLERTKTKLEMAEQDQQKVGQDLQKVMAMHLEDLDCFGNKVQALTTRNEELGRKLKEVTKIITIQQEEMKEMESMKVAKDEARSQCLDGMLFCWYYFDVYVFARQRKNFKNRLGPGTFGILRGAAKYP